ncbi:MAG: hypothetical protein WAT23_01495, partial [Chromatiaceae bacterium]
ADSLYFLTYDGMIEATGLPEHVFSASCFTGIYPTPIGKRAKEITHINITDRLVPEQTAA